MCVTACYNIYYSVTVCYSAIVCVLKHVAVQCVLACYNICCSATVCVPQCVIIQRALQFNIKSITVIW